MSAKKTAIAVKAKAATADAWVGEGREKVAAPAGPMKRLTIDIPEDDHHALKVLCAKRKTKIADEVRAFIRKYVEAEMQTTVAS